MIFSIFWRSAALNLWHSRCRMACLGILYMYLKDTFPRKPFIAIIFQFFLRNIRISFLLLCSPLPT